MIAALNLLLELRYNRPISRDTVARVLSFDTVLPAQAGAFAALLETSPKPIDAQLLSALRVSNEWLARFAAAKATDPCTRLVSGMVSCLRVGKEVGKENWNRMSTMIVRNQFDSTAAGYLMMSVLTNRLTTGDRTALATSLRDSGEIYDYRPTVHPRRLVRRYPTGALSEKVALILPSLISALSSTIPIASDFLVARSLGYTGGTYDKLLAIRGFEFPKPGPQTEVLLGKFGVAMCVTSDEVAPADRYLYQIRSVTGTVESEDLIVASIASKQGALPCDRLLLDVRYGAGAFLRDRETAIGVGSAIIDLLSDWGIPTTAAYLDTPWPTGSAVGNAVEVAEAIAVMGGPRVGWNTQKLGEQWAIVRSFLELIVDEEFGSREAARVAAVADECRSDGSLIRSFRDLLVRHSVASNEAEALIANPMHYFFGDQPGIPFLSSSNGTIIDLHQPRLGNIVNFELGAGGNDFGGYLERRAGVKLEVSRGQSVRVGDRLGTLYHTNSAKQSPELLHSLSDCFTVA